MELNVDNLIYMYEKARKEEVDIKEFFNIRSYNDAKFVLTPPVNRRVKKQQLPACGGKCFIAKIRNFSDI